MQQRLAHADPGPSALSACAGRWGRPGKSSLSGLAGCAELRAHHRSRGVRGRSSVRQRLQSLRCSASLRDDMDEIQQQILERQTVMEAHAAAEEYDRAAAVRDSIALLQIRRRHTELAMQRDATRVHLKVGQVIRHRKYDYKGVIVGYDKECDAPESWIRQMGVDTLPLGRHQPFYHVLCDEHDRPASRAGAATTYVAQENCNLLPPGAASPVANQLVDANFEKFVDGRYMPREHLREKYPDSEATESTTQSPPDSGAAESGGGGTSGDSGGLD